jgi:hypothetical protein
MPAEAGWRRWTAALPAISLVAGCQTAAAPLYIPAAYALTGLCVALLVSPVPAAAVAGVTLGGLLGAAVSNNSLKRGLAQTGERAAPRR